jgi:hypothetical protein
MDLLMTDLVDQVFVSATLGSGNQVMLVHAVATDQLTPTQGAQEVLLGYDLLTVRGLTFLPTKRAFGNHLCLNPKN